MAGMFDKFLAELTKTLGGGPGKEGRGDVGAFEQGAIEGGKRVLAPIGEVAKTALQPYSQSLASQYTEEDYQKMVANEAAKTLPMPTPMQDVSPIVTPLLPPQPAAEGPPVPLQGEVAINSAPTQASVGEPGLPSPVFKKSSRAKHKGDVGTQAVVEQGAKGPSSTPATDSIDDQLKANAAKYGAERDDALKAAADSQNMTQEEKIATALLAALPGLAGLIGGAAISGGGGAMAGLAGGLSGGAQGIQGIAADKKEKRKELLAKAEKAGDRLGRVDDQKLAHADTLQQQGFTSGMHEKDQKFQLGRDASNHKFESGQNAQRLAMQKYGIDVNALTDYQKAVISAEAKKQEGSSLKEGESNAMRYAARMRDAAPLIDGAENELATFGGSLATKSGWAKAMTDPKTRHAADAAGRWLAGILRKDSGAAITEEEWSTEFPKYFPTAADRSDKDAWKAKRQAREVEMRMMEKSAGPGEKMIKQVLDEVRGPGGQQTTQPSTSVWSTMKRVQ